MKKLVGIVVVALMLACTGCASLVEKEVDVNAGEAYDLNEYEFDDIPEGIYIKTENLLYAPYKGHTLSGSSSVSLLNYLAQRNSRFIWYTAQLGNVPVLNDDGIIIYKSDKPVPESFTLESYEKLCDSIGLRGLTVGNNGKYSVKSASDTTLKQGSSAHEELYELCSGKTMVIDNINGFEIEPSMVNKAGALTGLEKGKLYKLGFYIGTKYYEKNIVADTTYYSSKDYTMLESYDETRDGYIILKLPDLLEPGLYNIDGKGTFWYEGISAAEQVAEPVPTEPATEESETEATVPTQEVSETLPIGGYDEVTEAPTEEDTLPEGETEEGESDAEPEGEEETAQSGETE